MFNLYIMKRITLAVCGLLVSSLITIGKAQNIHKLITPEAVHSQIAFLACDAMKGRRVDSNESRIAQEYIIQQFRSLGVKPFFNDDYRQEAYIFDGKIRLDNVIGMIEGKNKDEYIVVGAHYDHIGTRNQHALHLLGVNTGSHNDDVEVDTIFNGADDNASGTVAVLQLAKAFAEQGFQPERTIVFALWDAEELRFRGSVHFVNTFPDIKQIKAYVNFDMIGRFKEENGVSNFQYFYTKAYPVFAKWMEKGIKRSKLDLPVNYYAEENVNLPSDNAPFAEKRIPVILFHTDTTDHLHETSDEIDVINVEKATDIIKAAHYVVRKLSQSHWDK